MKRNPYDLPGELIRKYRSNDPFYIAKMMKITVMPRSDFIRQKGAFVIVLGNAFILINENLSRQMQRIVCAHELGHALLHRQLCRQEQKAALYEMMLFDIKDPAEREANIFAAGLLIDDNEMLEYLKSGYSLLETARAMDTNVNLLSIRLHAMQDRMDHPENLPCMPGSSFLGTIGDHAGY